MSGNPSKNEQARLADLRRYNILDTLPEQVYDDIAFLAAQICQTPIALISLIDKDRQWFKAKIGVEDEQTSRDISFCSHAILEPKEIFTVTDAASDERFASNPSVTGAPHVRFYAGAPLVMSSGAALGSLCVIDRKPRVLNKQQQRSLLALARQVAAHLETRRQLIERDAEVTRMRQMETILRNSEQRIYSFLSHSPTVAFMKDEEGRIVFINKKMERVFNLRSDQLIGKVDAEWLPPETVQEVRENDRRVLETNQPLEIVETVSSPDGTSTHWLSLKFPFADSFGKRFVGGVAIDITERIKIEKRLEESEERSRQLFENSRGFICTNSLDGKILTINPAAAEALGYQPEELVGTYLQEILDPSVLPLMAGQRKRLKQYERAEGYFTILTKSKQKRVWKYHDVLYKPSDGPAYVIGHAQDVTELQQVQEHLRNLSITDELTGLYNLRGFQALAEQALKVARRSCENCCLLYADLDNLKQVNDLLGHDSGSQMIIEAAKILKKVFRESDIVARVGGDEFTVLMTGGLLIEENEIKQRLQKQTAEFNSKAVHPFALSLSVGLLSFDPNNSQLEEVMRQADSKMYQDKKNRKMNRATLIQATV